MWTLAWGCTWSFSEKPEKSLRLFLISAGAIQQQGQYVPNKCLSSLLSSLRCNRMNCPSLETASAVTFLFQTKYWWSLKHTLFKSSDFTSILSLSCKNNWTTESDVKDFWRHIEWNEIHYIALLQLKAIGLDWCWRASLEKQTNSAILFFAWQSPWNIHFQMQAHFEPINIHLLY